MIKALKAAAKPAAWKAPPKAVKAAAKPKGGKASAKVKTKLLKAVSKPKAGKMPVTTKPRAMKTPARPKAGRPATKARAKAKKTVLREVPFKVTNPEAKSRLGAITTRNFYEWECKYLWPKVWQMAARLEEIPKVGDWVEYRILDKSVIVVRAKSGVKAFHNACRHRGVQLASAGHGAIARTPASSVRSTAGAGTWTARTPSCSCRSYRSAVPWE